MTAPTVLDAYLPHVDSDFIVKGSNPPFPLTLTEAEPVGKGGRGASERQAFSLIYTGPDTFTLDQGLYALLHPELGELEIFLVPVGKGERGLQYQALFN